MADIFEVKSHKQINDQEIVEWLNIDIDFVILTLSKISNVTDVNHVLILQC